MNIEFRKKYEIVTGIINNIEESFTIGSLFAACELIGNKYNIVMTLQDVLCIIYGLYDGFELNREVAPDGTISFRKIAMYGAYDNYTSTR